MIESSPVNYLENVQVRVLDVKKSRSLVAKKSFASGETILCEKPIISSQFTWNKFYKYRACDHCMEPLEDAQENVRRLTENRGLSLPYLKECCATNKSQHVKCVECGVEYCSQACLQSAWETCHQTMCLGKDRENQEHPYNFLLSIWREMHLPPESTTIEIILKMLGQMKQQPDKETLLKKLRNFECSLVNEQEQIPHKLLNERYFSQLETIRELTNEYFKSHLYTKECEPWLTPEGFRRIFSLIGRNAQGIGTSPFSVWVENCSDKLKLVDKGEKKKLDKLIDKIYDNLDRVAGSFLNAEGSGLYELQSMCNHSCKPNAEISFKNNNFVLTLVALEEIKPEEEICISYLDECQLHRSRHSRQKMLRENYLFTCECERCQAESGQPDVTSDEDDEEEEDEEFETDDGSDEDETMED